MTTKHAPATPLPTEQYVPGSNPKAEQIMRRTARDFGYSLKFNTRGDWLVYRQGSQVRGFRGVIINVRSLSGNAPSPIGSKYIRRGELEPLRDAMNDALMQAGILEAANQARTALVRELGELE